MITVGIPERIRPKPGNVVNMDSEFAPNGARPE